MASFNLRRGFEIPDGARVLVVEDMFQRACRRVNALQRYQNLALTFAVLRA